MKKKKNERVESDFTQIYRTREKVLMLMVNENVKLNSKSNFSNRNYLKILIGQPKMLKESLQKQV
jgi:hypothetical protein